MGKPKYFYYGVTRKLIEYSLKQKSHCRQLTGTREAMKKVNSNIIASEGGEREVKMILDILKGKESYTSSSIKYFFNEKTIQQKVSDYIYSVADLIGFNS